MTSVHDIPYKDIKEFLRANNKNFDDKNDAYNKALILFKDRKAKGYTTSIIEWLIAHNLLVLKVDIPNYSIREISNMSQIEINRLAKLLTMSGNNRDNIINILKYLNRLNDEMLLPEINNIILNNLYELEASSINSKNLKFNEIIDLLKTHRDKALIRKLIYNNLENIILHNFLNIDIEKLDDLLYIESLLDESYEISKVIVIKLIKNNYKRILKNHTEEEIDALLDVLEDYGGNFGFGLSSNKNLLNLKKFVIDLIKIKETGLVKEIFNIAEKYRFDIEFNRYLIKTLPSQEDDVFGKLLEFIGENYFMNKLEYIYNFKSSYIKRLLKKLIKLEKYELLMKVLNLLMDKDYKGTRDIISAILTRMRSEKTIETKNNNLILKYIKILNLGLDGKLSLEKTSKNLEIIYNLIKRAEADKS